DQPASDCHPVSLHDALPICPQIATGPLRCEYAEAEVVEAAHDRCDRRLVAIVHRHAHGTGAGHGPARGDLRLREGHPERLVEAQDRKSTRLNSSHVKISYAV